MQSLVGFSAFLNCWMFLTEPPQLPSFLHSSCNFYCLWAVAKLQRTLDLSTTREFLNDWSTFQTIHNLFSDQLSELHLDSALQLKHPDVQLTQIQFVHLQNLKVASYYGKVNQNTYISCNYPLINRRRGPLAWLWITKPGQRELTNLCSLRMLKTKYVFKLRGPVRRTLPEKVELL